MTDSDYLFGAADIAQFLGWEESQVYRHKKKLPIGRFGGKMIASREKLKEHLDKQISMGDQNLIDSGS